jgi:hypothetical protein
MQDAFPSKFHPTTVVSIVRDASLTHVNPLHPEETPEVASLKQGFIVIRGFPSSAGFIGLRKKPGNVCVWTRVCKQYLRRRQ